MCDGGERGEFLFYEKHREETARSRKYIGLCDVANVWTSKRKTNIMLNILRLMYLLITVCVAFSFFFSSISIVLIVLFPISGVTFFIQNYRVGEDKNTKAYRNSIVRFCYFFVLNNNFYLFLCINSSPWV